MATDRTKLQGDEKAARTALTADATAIQTLINNDPAVKAAKQKLTTDEQPLVADRTRLQADYTKLRNDLRALHGGTTGTTGSATPTTTGSSGKA